MKNRTSTAHKVPLTRKKNQISKMKIKCLCLSTEQDGSSISTKKQCIHGTKSHVHVILLFGCCAHTYTNTLANTDTNKMAMRQTKPTI